MNLRRSMMSLSFALVCLTPAIAHADTIYGFGGTLVDGGSFYGTLTFGTTPPIPCSVGCTTITGQEVTGDNFKVVDGGITYSFTNMYGVGGTQNQPYSEYFF